MKFTPLPYQTRLAQCVVDTPQCALWLKMGLRKTSITLTAIRELVYFGDVSRVLVVGPKRVVTHAWPAELNKWDTFRELTYTVLRGDASWRLTLTNRKTDIHLINYENIAWLITHRLRDWPYDMVVLDESSRIKNPDSERFRALRKLLTRIDNAGLDVRFVELTGTHSPNSLQDVWSQLYVLDRGQRLGATLGAFRERWFRTIRVDEYTKRIATDCAEHQIADAVGDVVFALTGDESLQLPPLVVNPIKVPLPPGVMAQYKQFEKEMLLEFKAATEDATHNVTALSAASLTGKCLQFASGAIYLQDELGHPTDQWAEVHKAKLDALEDVIEEAGGQRVLVVYWFKHDLVRILDRFPEARVLKKDADLDAWNRKEIAIGLINPGSAGHGLNLQDGGSTLVWFSMQWSLELYQQTNARLHRSGQTDTVTVHLLMAEGTIDEDVPKRLEGKATVQELLAERLKLL